MTADMENHPLLTKEVGPVSWVFEPNELTNLIEQIASSSEVVMDLETTGLDEHAEEGGHLNGGVGSRISLASFTLPQRKYFSDTSSGWDGAMPTTYVVPLSHHESPWRGQWRNVLKQIASTMTEYSRPFVNANVKFDSRWMYAITGIDLSPLIAWDTQVSSHLVDENKSTALKVRAPETFGIEPWNDGIDFSQPGAAEQIELFHLGVYAALDTWWTWRLYVRHRGQLYLPYGDYDPNAEEPPITPEETQNARLGNLANWVAMPTVQSLTRIEQHGMRLDIPWVERQLAEEEAIAARMFEQVVSRYDYRRADASLAPTSKWFREFTEIAVEKGDLRVITVTANGAPQWNKAALKNLARNGYPLADDILEYRQAAKRVEYLRSWLEEVSPSGFIHTTYWPGRVVTGRLSSSGPNMQQVTRALRPAFIPREGYVMADFDYSQIELRVAAFISRCEPMMQAYHDGRDLHNMIAARVVGVPVEAVTPEQRQMGKASNFGLIYGQEAAGFVTYADAAYGVELTMHEAQVIHKEYFDLWEGLREWHASVKEDVLRNGFVESPLGRVRRLPGIWSSRQFEQGEAERKAINSPVQGTASDLLMMAAASMQGFLMDSSPIDDLRLVATVHDSIVGEIPEARWQAVCEQVTERMTNLDEVLDKMGVKFDVPLQADATVGTRWGLSDVGEL